MRGTETEIQAFCPSHYKAMGGGFQWDGYASPFSRSAVLSSYSVDDVHRVVARSIYDDPGSGYLDTPDPVERLRAQAICIPE